MGTGPVRTELQILNAPFPSSLDVDLFTPVTKVRTYGVKGIDNRSLWWRECPNNTPNFHKYKHFTNVTVDLVSFGICLQIFCVFWSTLEDTGKNCRSSELRSRKVGPRSQRTNILLLVKYRSVLPEHPPLYLHLYGTGHGPCLSRQLFTIRDGARLINFIRV